MEKSKAGTKEKISPCGVSVPNQYIIIIIKIINKIWYYFTIHGKSSTKFNKNEMDLNNRMINHPLSPDYTF